MRSQLFNELPIVASVDGRMLCMHGGISQTIKGWDTLKEMKVSLTATREALHASRSLLEAAHDCGV